MELHALLLLLTYCPITFVSDPQIQPLKEGGEFAKALYNGDGFLGSLYNGLTDHGILLAQVGQSPRYNEPAEEHSWLQNRLLFLKALANLGFESIQDYNEVSRRTSLLEPCSRIALCILLRYLNVLFSNLSPVITGSLHV